MRVVSGFVDKTPQRTVTANQETISDTAEKGAQASVLDQIKSYFTMSNAGPKAPPIPDIPEFSLRSFTDVDVQISVDGNEAHKGKYKPKRERTVYQFERRLEFWTDNVSQLEIGYNGRKIRPQGSVSKQRKLVFAMDRSDLEI